MKVVRDNETVEHNKKSVITVGTFDGVHSGHKKIISFLNERKYKKGLRSVVVTFDPHPQAVLKNKAKDIKILTTTDEKLEIFKKLDVDLVYIINFTKEFSQTSAEDFIKGFLVEKIGLSELVIGYDHMFGKDRQGSIETIKKLSEEFGFEADRVDEYKIEGEVVSSTTIRRYLSEGNIAKANLLLGREYSIEGKVVEGFKRGRAIGYPTANIRISDEMKQIPKIGIYAVTVELDKYYQGMMSIGYNPTVSDEKKINLEVHIFDFDRDIYGEKIKVNFVDYIRDEVKFDNLELMKSEIDNDKMKCLDMFSRM